MSYDISCMCRELADVRTQLEDARRQQQSQAGMGMQLVREQLSQQAAAHERTKVKGLILLHHSSF